MYYKITNQESELFKKAKELMERIRTIDQKNRTLIRERVEGVENLMGSHGFNLTWSHAGVTFKRGFVPPVEWKRHKKNPSMFVPTGKTKEGKRLQQFFSELEGVSIMELLKLLNEDLPHGRITLPRVYGSDRLILILLDEQHNPKFPDLIEITRSEFTELGKEIDRYNAELNQSN